MPSAARLLQIFAGGSGLPSRILETPISQPATTPPERGGRSSAHAVAETIKAWLVERELRPGDRLPGETELIAEFGAAKGTVREAMRLLEAQGLVRSRTGPGGGHFVHEVSELRAQSLLGNYFFFQEPTIGDVYQLRRLLEPELAASLAGKLSEDALRRLELAMAPYENPPESIEESEAQRIAELGFHEVLAELSDNPLLAFQTRFLISLLKNLATCRKIYKRRIPDFRRRGRDYQARLIQALRAGDAGAARAIMKAHMQSAQLVMERQEATLPRDFLSGERKAR